MYSVCTGLTQLYLLVKYKVFGKGMYESKLHVEKKIRGETGRKETAGET